MSVKKTVKLTRSEELQLLEQIRSGSGDAFDILASAYQSVILANVSRVHIKGVDFEDLIQEAYMALFKAACNYSPDAGASFHTYAEICISNRLSSVARRSGTNKSKLFSDYSDIAESDVAADSGYEPEFAVFARDRIDTIYGYISELLSESENRVLMLYLSGSSYADIARELDITEKAVDNALQRARRKLKNAIDGQI